MAYATHSPLKAAADLLESLLDEADLENDLEEIAAAMKSMRRSLERLEAGLEAMDRANTRQRLSLVDGGGDDA